MTDKTGGPTLTADDITVGRVYEAKRPRGSGFPALTNDRQVKWVSPIGDAVQYDSPTVPMGRQYPTIPMERFLKWAGRDCTDDMPQGEWRAHGKVPA